jgi:RimJ/RimL family protein N-acetyltransferase
VHREVAHGPSIIGRSSDGKAHDPNGIVPTPNRNASARPRSIRGVLPDLPADDQMRISTTRLDLVPLTSGDADDLFPVLGDAELGRYTGEPPPADLGALRVRFAAWEARRSPDGSELWLNWTLRRRDDGRAVGYVQATIGDGDAAVAWTVGTPTQRQGLATEAAGALIAWLRDALGIPSIVASIHPDNIASRTVAERIGLRPTERCDAGEVVWEDVASPGDDP